MNIEAFEKREEIFRLRAALEIAEASRVYGEPTYTLEQSRKLLSDLVKVEEMSKEELFASLQEAMLDEGQPVEDVFAELRKEFSLGAV